jgi:putative ABC transport system permease protein
MWTALRALVSRLRFVASRRRLSDDAAQELQAHLDLLTERYVESGMTPGEARLSARRQMGNVTLVREDIYRMNSVRWFDVLAQDVRYAFRALGRNPSFAAVVVATLALGIGANTAILSAVYSVLIRPLPYERPDQIYSVGIVVPERREQMPSLPASIQTYLEWRRSGTAFSDVGAIRPWEASVTGDGEPERLSGARISANFFSLLGVPMAHGRAPVLDEEQPGGERVVVISDALWRRRYGADPAAIGRTILVNGQSHAVIGVAPPALLVPTGTQLHPLLPFGPRVDIWKPLAPDARDLRNESWDHGVLVRLAHVASVEEGRQQLATLVNALIRAQLPDVKTQLSVQLIPMREIYAGKIRLRLLLVLAASALLLLTACASIANVFLARMASRANEFATRVALGASRARILSQTLTETMLFAMIGGAVGALLAAYGASALASYAPDDLRLMADRGLNVPLLLFALSVSLLTGIVCGIVPAWQACRRDPGVDLQQAARTAVGGRRAGRMRNALVGIEIAFATVLLASASLLLHSFVNVMNADRGYDVDRILAVDLSLFGQRYSAGAARDAFYGALLDRVRALPGVVAAGAVSSLPALSGSDGASPTIFHSTDTDFQRVVLSRPVALVRSVTAGYFTSSGTALRAGRFLDGEEPVPAAVISESLAAALWPGELPSAAVGRQLRQGSVTGPLIAIAGVVADTRPGGLDRKPSPVVYRPYKQWPSGPMTVVIRTATEPGTLSQAVRSEVQRLDADLPVAAMRTMREIVEIGVAQRQFQMTLTSLFAVVALLLGALGVYGVASYAVACRTRDIGLRMALGALRTDVLRWILIGGMRPVVIGLAAGLIGAIGIARALRALLFEITPTDPLSLGASVLVLLTASGLACYLPARRAASLDPVIALRHE